MENLNYKIQVKDNVDELVNLFSQLGCEYFNHTCTNKKFMLVEDSLASFCKLKSNFRACKSPEITITQLKDLVVLKRNSVDDATHTDQDNWKWYIGADSYVWQAGNAEQINRWDKASLDHVDLKPISKMKEYLVPQGNGKYALTTSNEKRVSDWVEVVDGAVSLIYNEDNRGLYHFVDSEGWLMSCEDIKNNEGYWYKDIGGYKNYVDTRIVWQRHTQPEELPFVDESLNNQCAEIEAVRKHSHYYIDVSDVNEIDFYEIAKRYNVTDPAIQHILKKCLAVGHRGHKDMQTDLQDILDTAKRAVEINK